MENPSAMGVVACRIDRQNFVTVLCARSQTGVWMIEMDKTFNHCIAKFGEAVSGGAQSPVRFEANPSAAACALWDFI